MSIFPSASSEVQSDEWKFSSIGGWLIVIAIGLCISPLVQIGFIVANLIPIFTKGAWSVLTTPGSPAYHRLWAPMIMLELFMNLAFIVMEAILLFWLFKRSHRFPKVMIGYLFVVFFLVAFDYFMAQAIPVVAAQDNVDSRVTLIRAGVVCAIWVPYLLRSKRVKGTFTN